MLTATDEVAAIEQLHSLGCTDGLPVVIPTPERVARIIARVMRSNRHEITLTAGGKSLIWLDRIFPTMADRIVARFGQ